MKCCTKIQSLKLLRHNVLGGDTFTRNVTDRLRTDRLWYEINIPFCLKEKGGKIMYIKGKLLK